MSTTDDAQFMRLFGMVLGLLAAFTIFIMILANSISPATDRSTDSIITNTLIQQLGPVGRSRVED